MLSDSRTAVLNYAQNRVCSVAARVLRTAGVRDSAVCVKWFPAHMGPSVSRRGNDNHNETAHAAARGLADRAVASGVEISEWQPPEGNQDPLTTYNEVLQWYRFNRRTMPPPHPGLTRAEAVLYRQLQTDSILTPVLARHVCPEVYESDICRLCERERATTAHLLWNCQLRPREASETTTLPPQYNAAKKSKDYNTQLQAVQQVAAALERQRPECDARKGVRSPRPRRARPGAAQEVLS